LWEECSDMNKECGDACLLSKCNRYGQSLHMHK
jgi:hypothetical protein